MTQLSESASCLSLEYLADQLGASLVINPAAKTATNTLVTGIATLRLAGASEIGFLANPKYRRDLENTTALAVILHESMLNECPTHALVHPDPYQAYACLLYTSPSPRDGTKSRMPSSA